MIYPVRDFKLKWKIDGNWTDQRDGYIHGGCDLNIKTGGNTDLGQDLLSIADGEVTHVESIKTGFGKHIHIKHEGAWGTVWSHYAHCNEILVNVGDKVKEGQKVATLGNTGNSKTAHLHFEIKTKPAGVRGVAKTMEELKDKWTDPLAFIEKWMSQPMPETNDWQQERDARNENWNLYQGEIAAHKLTKDKHEAFIKQLSSIYGSPEDEESIVKFATENAKVLDERDLYKDKYEREVQSRKQDYENYQKELEGYKREIEQLRAEKEALGRRLNHVEQKINDTIEDATIAKEKIEEKKKEYPQYSSDIANNFIQSMIRVIYEKAESVLTKRKN